MGNLLGTRGPSRSGAAPIVTPGLIRLIKKLLFFALATWSLYDVGWIKISLVFSIVVVAHYIVSYDRIMWLMAH
jgi:RsiW-degrading membrane proteinase PrsW (M82 family)